MATTQELMNDACRLVGLAPITALRGSTEPAPFYHAIAAALGISLADPVTSQLLSKGRLTETIIRAAGLSWDDDWDGRTTPSGGGGTVSNEGLEQLVNAIRVLQGISGSPPAPPARVGTGLGVVAPLKVTAEIEVRRQRAVFKSALLSAYGGACAVSGTTWEPVLEAAHIEPYSVSRDNSVSNGILLRRDVHALFDRHWLLINPTTYEIVFHRSVSSVPAEYGAYAGKTLHLPASADNHPDRHRLETIWALWTGV